MLHTGVEPTYLTLNCQIKENYTLGLCRREYFRLMILRGNIGVKALKLFIYFYLLKNCVTVLGDKKV